MLGKKSVYQAAKKIIRMTFYDHSADQYMSIYFLINLVQWSVCNALEDITFPKSCITQIEHDKLLKDIGEIFNFDYLW